MFRDRTEAGEKLAARLVEYRDQYPLVLAIPRGGAVVGAEVAKALKAPLDLIIPRKIGTPANEEMAIGAVTQDGTVILDQTMMGNLGLKEKDLAGIIKKEQEEIKRRMALYRGFAELPRVQGKTVILVDDGIATGYTVMAAVKSLRKLKPRQLILAVPVAPQDTIGKFKVEVDRVVCLETPEIFYAVGQFYQDFGQTADEEVIELLGKKLNAQKNQK